MTSTCQWFVAGLLLLFALGPASVSNGQTIPEPRQTALRLHIDRSADSVDVTCVLVRREERGRDAVLYFVTTAHVFKGPHGEQLPPPRSMTMDIDGGGALGLSMERVSISSLVGVAVFKAIAHDTALAPPALTLAVPTPETPFFVSGFDVGGSPVQSVQRVGRVATLSVLGDRTVSPVADCRGAAAIGERGVFGIVTDCTDGMAPVIVPFAAIAKWVGRYVPGGLALQAPLMTEFHIKQQELSSPLLTVACGEEQTGDLEVPFMLSPGEAAIAASANFRKRSSLRLADVSVLRIADQSVTLRFTLAGEEPSRFRPPVPCPQGQALVTIRLDVISRRAP